MISLESPLAGRLVKSAPEPWNDAAVTIPVTFTPVAVTIPQMHPSSDCTSTLTVSKNVDTPTLLHHHQQHLDLILLLLNQHC